jgi:tRNA threonylcarbamoyladenosine biosynthesis protein TsaB
MLILAIDTSGKNGGIALARGDAQRCDVVASAALAGGTYSAQLIPKIEELLQSQKLALRDVEGFAVAAGPGSFTGLRVGLATVKGLAEIVDRPIAAVSVLDAVVDAAQPGAAVPHGLMFAAIDAGRGEVFLAEYSVADGKRQLQRELIVSRAELVAHVRGQEQSGAGAVATSDDVIAQALADGGLIAVRVKAPGADDIARLGLRQLAAGETTPAVALDANYIRRSDAELFSQAQQKSTTESRRHGDD